MLKNYSINDSIKFRDLCMALRVVPEANVFLAYGSARYFAEQKNYKVARFADKFVAYPKEDRQLVLSIFEALNRNEVIVL